mmetsp:Transcript_4673/g.12789  ORF Transcript_4673/g.12789 Transcript_4673/m.12789 type:complete len:407 (-) Transcript_4673:1156-2376(-)
MERLLAATGGFFSKGKGVPSEKRGVEEIFQDARLVSTSRTKMGRPKHVAKDLTNREQKAVIGSKGQYELDGDIEAELQAELGELVERVQSIHYSGRLAELDVDELLEDALEEDGGPGADSQYMSVSVWEERLAEESRRKQQLQQQLQRQKSRRKSAFHSGDTGLQVERSSASCSALQHQQRKSLPKVNLKSKSKTAQEDSQRLLATPPGPLSKRGSKGDLQTFSRESPTLMRTRGSEVPPNAKPSLASFNMPTPLTISSDSYDSPIDASPATPASYSLFSLSTPSQERSNSRPHMLPPLQIHPSRAGAGSQDSTNSSSTTPGSTKAGQPQLRPSERQGSLMYRNSPKSQSGSLVPINAQGRASLERSSSRAIYSKAGGIALSPMGGSGGLLTANSIYSNARQPRIS